MEELINTFFNEIRNYNEVKDYPELKDEIVMELISSEDEIILDNIVIEKLSTRFVSYALNKLDKIIVVVGSANCYDMIVNKYKIELLSNLILEFYLNEPYESTLCPQLDEDLNYEIRDLLTRELDTMKKVYKEVEERSILDIKSEFIFSKAPVTKDRKIYATLKENDNSLHDILVSNYNERKFNRDETMKKFAENFNEKILEIKKYY